MNKSELIADLAERAELSKADAGRALEALIDAVKASLHKGEDVPVALAWFSSRIHRGLFHVIRNNQ